MQKNYLTAFEKYMILDDHPDYPMTLLIEWAFRGKIHREKLLQAYQISIKNEPLFQSVAVRRHGKWFWETDTKHTASLEFEEVPGSVEQDVGILEIEKIDIQKECAKVVVREYSDGVSFIIFFHHSIGDALGIHHFFCSWMQQYDQLLHPDRNTEENIFVPDVSLFPKREELHFVPPEPVSRWAAIRKFQGWFCQWFLRRPLPLIQASCVPNSQNLSVPHYWKKISSDIFLKYKAAAKSHGVSMNTLMIRDLYLTLNKWTQKYPFMEKKRISSRLFRMLIPMNLRNDFHAKLPCSNVLGYIFLDRRPRECDRSEVFLQTIQRDMAFCRKWNVGSAFINGLHLVEKIPGLLTLLTSTKFCHCTTVFSSMGNLCKSSFQKKYRENDTIRVDGDYPLDLIRIVGAPPVRSHTPISIGVIQHGNDMFLSFRYDARFLTQEVVAEMLGMFVDEMKQSIP